MKVPFLIILLFIPLVISFSFDLGGALSIDYYNNPIEDSAPSPIQQRPIIFQNLNIKLFNLRTGIGITEGCYEVNSDVIPVFNDYYEGFYTLEFDVFVYPGLLVPITDSFSLGLAAGGGVRLPVLVKVDIGNNKDVDGAFSWFYEDYHYLFWGAQLFTTFKLPLSSDVKFFGTVHYKDFIFRDNEWIIGATAGLLWHMN